MHLHLEIISHTTNNDIIFNLNSNCEKYELLLYDVITKNNNNKTVITITKQ